MCGNAVAPFDSLAWFVDFLIGNAAVSWGGMVLAHNYFSLCGGASCYFPLKMS